MLFCHHRSMCLSFTEYPRITAHQATRPGKIFVIIANLDASAMTPEAVSWRSKNLLQRFILVSYHQPIIFGPHVVAESALVSWLSTEYSFNRCADNIMASAFWARRQFGIGLLWLIHVCSPFRIHTHLLQSKSIHIIGRNLYEPKQIVYLKNTL